MPPLRDLCLDPAGYKQNCDPSDFNVEVPATPSFPEYLAFLALRNFT